jgi:hypothetical protein
LGAYLDEGIDLSIRFLGAFEGGPSPPTAPSSRLEPALFIRHTGA